MTLTAEQHRARYHADPEAARQRLREKNRRLRLAVLELLGGKCVCCGETEEAFLSVDHVHGGGLKHRSKGYQAMMWEIKREVESGDYQVLCYNCNHAKERPEGCPHQRSSR